MIQNPKPSPRTERVQLLVNKILGAVGDQGLDLLSLSVNFDCLGGYLRQMGGKDVCALFEECNRELAGGHPWPNAAYFEGIAPLGNALGAVYALEQNLAYSWINSDALRETLGKIVREMLENAVSRTDQQYVCEVYFRCIRDDHWLTFLPLGTGSGEKRETELDVILRTAVERKDVHVLMALGKARREALLSAVEAEDKAEMLSIFDAFFSTLRTSDWREAASQDPAYQEWLGTSAQQSAA